MKVDDPSDRHVTLVRHGTRALCFHSPPPPPSGWQRIFQRCWKVEKERTNHVEGLNLLFTDCPLIDSGAARDAAIAMSRFAENKRRSVLKDIIRESARFWVLNFTSEPNADTPETRPSSREKR